MIRNSSIGILVTEESTDGKLKNQVKLLYCYCYEYTWHIGTIADPISHLWKNTAVPTSNV